MDNMMGLAEELGAKNGRISFEHFQVVQVLGLKIYLAVWGF